MRSRAPLLSVVIVILGIQLFPRFVLLDLIMVVIVARAANVKVALGAVPCAAAICAIAALWPLDVTWTASREALKRMLVQRNGLEALVLEFIVF